MLEICAIASGSNGNCYYIGNENSAILIDAGISAKQILKRMQGKDLSPEKVKAVFISHEHGDHMRGARVLSKRLNIPVYLTAKTFNKSYKNLRPDYPRFFTPNDTIAIDDFLVHSFPKNHDAADPCSFRVEYKHKSVGVLTDIGAACNTLKHHLSLCHALFLEANYDESMLWEGKYPHFLKERVAGDYGHLSNDQCFDLLENHSHQHLQCVFLSHISKENNTPEKAFNRMGQLSRDIPIKIAPRYEASEIFRL